MNHLTSITNAQDQNPYIKSEEINQFLPDSAPAIYLSREHAAIEAIQTSAIFGCEIPYIPTRNLTIGFNQTQEENRINEAIQHFRQIIRVFAKYPRIVFSLRILSDPNLKRIRIGLLTRVFDLPAEISVKIYRDIVSSFNSIDYPIQPITDPNELSQFINPFDQPKLINIQKREEMMEMEAGMAYTVMPFVSPKTTWKSLAKNILAQTESVLISLSLEPTRLTSIENQTIQQSIQIAEAYADYQSGYYSTQRIIDPIARLVGKLYQHQLSELQPPFLYSIQVASEDPFTTYTIANALAIEISEQRSSSDVQNTQALPCGFSLVAPQTALEEKLSRFELERLEMIRWSESEAADEQARFPHLVGAEEASSFFRLPIPTHRGIPGIPTQEILPDYQHVMVKEDGATISLGLLSNRQPLNIPLNNFLSHTFIAGTTLSGKTNTTHQILGELVDRDIPFLVIEPVKSEYRNLSAAGLKHPVRVFTLGDESTSPFRLNPFHLLPGITVEYHITQLRLAFEAAMPTFSVLPALIEESLYKLYLNKKWSSLDTHRGNGETRILPTMGEFYFEIIRNAEQKGYSEKTLQDIRSAAATRVGGLLRGSKGKMFNTLQSISIDELLSQPTVLELQQLNRDEQAFAMMLILIFLREKYLHQESSDLKHVVVIEEAHRLLTKTNGVNRELEGNASNSAVEMVTQMLAEIRAYGEGMIIVDQIPGQLVDSVIKNTNTKIIHKLPGADDRESVGSAISMSTEQKEYLSKLPLGAAAFFTEK